MDFGHPQLSPPIFHDRVNRMHGMRIRHVYRTIQDALSTSVFTLAVHQEYLSLLRRFWIKVTQMNFQSIRGKELGFLIFPAMQVPCVYRLIASSIGEEIHQVKLVNRIFFSGEFEPCPFI